MGKLSSAVLSSSVLVLSMSPLAHPAERPDPAAPARPAAEAGNAFAADLYQRLSKEKGNLFFSPHSIHVALAMAWAGAKGETAAEMGKVLHLQGMQDPQEALGALLEVLNAGAKVHDDELYRLVVANSLWGQSGYLFHKEYLEGIRKAFGGGLRDVDFIKAAEAARAAINGWVEETTAQKIKDLIGPGILTPDTRLVLANAIYMKAAWDEPFRKELTKDAPFFLTGGSQVKAPLMRRFLDHSPYFEDDLLQAAEIPYRMGRLSMVVLLPKRKDGLPALEKRLDEKTLAAWLGRLSGKERGGLRKVDLTLPRFKLECRPELTRTLQAMGMVKAFRYPAADFSGIEPKKELFIGDVLHKAYVDVNEEGTEAAAATAVVMRAGAAPAPEEPVVFRADHPFLFLIRHRATGAVLFMGRLEEPGR